MKNILNILGVNTLYTYLPWKKICTRVFPNTNVFGRQQHITIIALGILNNLNQTRIKKKSIIKFDASSILSSSIQKGKFQLL